MGAENLRRATVGVSGSNNFMLYLKCFACIFSLKIRSSLTNFLRSVIGKNALTAECWAEEQKHSPRKFGADELRKCLNVQENTEASTFLEKSQTFEFAVQTTSFPETFFCDISHLWNIGTLARHTWPYVRKFKHLCTLVMQFWIYLCTLVRHTWPYVRVLIRGMKLFELSYEFFLGSQVKVKFWKTCHFPDKLGAP